MSRDRVVYVGHIPFDMTEEQIEDIFRSAGPVEQTRLVFDKASGKSKGFAFVQYYEPESAASAVRNLDNYKVGNMNLKVNYSQGRIGGGGGNGNGNGNGNKRGGSEESGGASVGPGTAAEDAGVDAAQNASESEILGIVGGMPQTLKLELLGELKAMVSERYSDTQILLDRNPQLVYAIIQVLYEFGLINDADAASLIISGPQSYQPANLPPQPGTVMQGGGHPIPPPPLPPQHLPPHQIPPHQLPPQHLPPQHLPPQQQLPPFMPLGATPSPVPAPAPAPFTPMPAPVISNEQRQMFYQIMMLTPQQLDAMPEEQRNTALAIRARIQSGEIVL